MTLLPVAAVHPLVPNAVIREKWLCPYSDEFGFSFVQWEEMKACRLSLLLSVEKKMKKLGGIQHPLYLPANRSYVNPI